MKLDSFETELLTELRALVTERTSDPVKTPRRFRPVRISLIAAASIAVSAVAIVPTMTATPAFAVTDEPSGTIHVQINKLEDADGLRAALEAHGVNADITYLGFEMRCAPGRLAPDPRTEAAYHSATRVSVGRDRVEITLDARDVADGRAVVIAASKIGGNGVYAEVDIGVQGPIPPCEPVPLTSTFDHDEDTTE